MAVTACLTNYGENWVLNAVFTNPTSDAGVPAANGLWASLWTTSPTQVAGSGTECSGNNYGRALLTFGAPVVNSAGNMQVSITATATFPVPSGSWGTIVAAGIEDSQTGGNEWCFSPVYDVNGNPTSFTVTTGVAPTYQSGYICCALQ